MLLVIDIGNTHTVFGLMEGAHLLSHWRLTSALLRTEDEIGMLFSAYLQQNNYKWDDIDGVAISSVVPELTASHVRMSKKYLQKMPLIIHSKLKLGMEIKYKDPRTVGADRICNAIAGRKKYGSPLIILDFGTATTFDCVDMDGNYLGGVIAPGVETSISALHRRAAKLPQVELVVPSRSIGRTTEESIQIGILKGAIHTVHGLVSGIREELGDEAPVVATGGLSKVIAAKTSIISHIEPFLSLEGIALIYAMNR